jgi:hypothetical protein
MSAAFFVFSLVNLTSGVQISWDYQVLIRRVQMRHLLPFIPSCNDHDAFAQALCPIVMIRSG